MPVPVDLDSLDLYDITAKVLTATGSILVTLRTDSPKLGAWFHNNWGRAGKVPAADASLIALVHPPKHYGLSSLDGMARWWCEDGRELWCFGTESYTVLKVSVRGICSAVCSDSTLFAHGCTFELQRKNNSVGVLLMGASGAGKTTLMASLLSTPDVTARVVNDDWGSVCLETGLARATGESQLHMKWRSVQAFQPRLSENTVSYIERSNDRPAVLIPPHRVFGVNCLTEQVKVSHAIVLTRDPRKPFSAHLAGVSADFLEAGAYSSYYRGVEPFYNGALMLVDDHHLQRQREAYVRLTASTKTGLINNVLSPSTMTRAFLDLLETG